MRVFAYALLVLAISIVQTSASCNREPECLNETISAWINYTLEYVKCINATNPQDNICLSISISGGLNCTADNPARNISFTFNSTVGNASCANQTTPFTCGSSTATSSPTTKISTSSPTQTTTPTTTPTTTTTTTTTTTATSSTTTPSETKVREEANSIEASMKTAVQNLSDADNKFIVFTNLAQNSKSLYTSNNTGTSVDEMDFSEGTNLTGAKVVINEKRIEGLQNGVFITAPSPSTASVYQQFFGNRFLGISAFDSNSNYINVSKVKFSIDVSSGNKSALCKKAIQRDTAAESELIANAKCKNVRFLCVFHENGTWSSSGCRVVKSDQNKWTCECNHTTVFAVLMSATVVSVPQSVKVVSYVAEAISIAFLVVTVTLLAKVRNRVRGDRVKVQICVASSLLCLHFVNVLHDAALKNDTACEMIAVLTHYFLLCSALWMLMEGVTLLFKTMDTVMRYLNGKNAKKFAIFRYVFSFTVPALIVGISVAVGFSRTGRKYMPPNENNSGSLSKYAQCWIGEDFLIGAVVIPISIILLCCLLIIFRMFYVVFRMSSESENYKPTAQRRPTTSGDFADLQHVKAALKATLVLFPVLGIPWILGFFTGVNNREARTTFMYVNTVVNGLQGVMVFFVYCVIGKEVRTAIMKSFTRKMYSMSSSFEFSSKQRRMTSDHSSIAPHGTLSTNLGDNFSDGDRSSNKSVDATLPETDKL